MTPQEFVAVLESFNVTPEKAQFNPKRTGTSDIAAGRVKLEYRGKSFITTVGVSSAKGFRRKVVKLIDPSMSMGSCRGKIRNAGWDVLLKKVNIASDSSINSADIGKMVQKVAKSEVNKTIRRTNQCIKNAHYELSHLFESYGKYLTKEKVLELWELSVVKEILES